MSVAKAVLIYYIFLAIDTIYRTISNDVNHYTTSASGYVKFIFNDKTSGVMFRQTVII